MMGAMSFADALDVLHEDNHCLALNKPAGWPTTHFDGTDETVDRLAKSYLKEKYQKPGNVFLGVVHRLDKPVSGALLFARTSKAAARLSEQFREGVVEKVYWAVVENQLASGRREPAVPCRVVNSRLTPAARRRVQTPTLVVPCPPPRSPCGRRCPRRPTNCTPGTPAPARSAGSSRRGRTSR